MDPIAQANKLLRAYIGNTHQTDRQSALERVRLLMHELGDPQEQVRVLHVAGTSGKTSTAYYLAQMLHAAGKRVGLTVSPHVDSVTERVQVNGQSLADQEFYELLKMFVALPAVGRAQPTYLGLLVSFAYWVFALKRVDYAVIEVSMGGLLDATNVVQRPDKVCIITDIGLDHTEFLGKDLASIAGHKGGIIQPGNLVFAVRQAPVVMRVLNEIAQSQGALLAPVVPDTSDVPHALPLFQQRNWALARTVYKAVAERDGLRLSVPATAVQVPARMEAAELGGKVVITDGAHNAQKIAALCAAMRATYGGTSMAAMVSLAQGKNASVMKGMRSLRSLTGTIIITTFDPGEAAPKRPIDPVILERAAYAAGFRSVSVIGDPLQAFQALCSLEAEVLLVTGSFYILNHVRPLLHKTS